MDGKERGPGNGELEHRRREPVVLPLLAGLVALEVAFPGPPEEGFSYVE